jgi:glutathione synthase
MQTPTTMMNIAFIADPLDGFKTYKDSTFAMMAEAVARGHQVHAFEPRDMALSNGTVSANVAQLTLTGDADDWYRASPRSARSLADFDVVVMRKDPPFDMEYVYATYLLQLAEKAGARIVNRPAAIRDHNEKLAIAEFPQFTTPTLATSDEKRRRACAV